VTESQVWDESIEDVEAMVRAAGHYVRTSDDLRPRVLEAARLQCGEQRAQRCLRRLAAFVVLVALFTAADRHGIDEQRSSFNNMLIEAGFEELDAPAPPDTIRVGDGDWRIIDAFTKLRRQQARLFRLEI
jgi:hypothetical protein